MLTFLMFAAVIGFAVVMRERTKHKDDYRYVAAQYLICLLYTSDAADE